MKLGLVTDIHEQVAPLRIALEHFARDRVDKIVVIGDVFMLGEDLDETCRLLAGANAIGVWGNHDFGICSDPSSEQRAAYSPTTMAFLTSLRPRLEVEGCYFSHVEPWLDPENVADLWYFDGPPDEHEKLDRIFRAVPNRVMFGGHYHKWLLVTPEGVRDWSGGESIRLSPQERYYVVIGALCDGWYAIYDTDSRELEPFTTIRA